MRRDTLLLSCAALLLAAPGAWGQSSAPPGGHAADPVLACLALGVGELRTDVSGFRKLSETEIVRRLHRRLLRDAQDPGVQAMLACMLRRTAE